MIVKYIPRGNDSLLSDDITGITKGNDSIKYQNDILVNYVDENGISYKYLVSVCENTIFFNDSEIGGIEEFEKYIKDLDRRYPIFLVDDFAVSPTYHKVEELIDNYGIDYKTEGDK